MAVLIMAYRRYLAPLFVAAFVAWFALPAKFTNRLIFAFSGEYVAKSTTGRTPVRLEDGPPAHCRSSLVRGGAGHLRRHERGDVSGSAGFGWTTSTCSWRLRED